MIFQELFAVRLIINIRRHNQRLLVVQEALSVELKGLLLIYAPGVFGSFCTARRPGSSANSEPIRMKAIPSPIFQEITSPKIKNANTGAKTGFKKNTREVSWALVSSIAIK